MPPGPGEVLSQRLLQAALAHLNDIIVITEAGHPDQGGLRIIYVNESFERRTGYAAHEVLGRKPSFLRGPKTSPAGEEFWLEIDINPIYAEDGKHTHLIAVERDIT
ncbi:MAG: PAS domain S-box protein [Candidatus Protistobacter heckmanni]|nr:PAS domain S-box protein [Candidatus Protistobacter heckmanni]